MTYHGGRKPGAKNRRTLQREARVAAIEAGTALPSAKGYDRIDCLVVMEEAMRFFYETADKARKKDDIGGFKSGIRDAITVAKDLAPYRHPRLTTTRIGGDESLPPIRLEQLTDSQLDYLLNKLMAGLSAKDDKG
jgi:hypothetical protein